MVDREVLKAFGLDPEGLRKKFEGKRETRSDAVNAFIDRAINRCRGGRDLNLEKSNVYYALDTAWDAAFNQITPTLLQTIIDKSADSPEVLQILKSAGMDPSRVITETKDPKTPEKSYKRVEVPAFFNITVPLCMAYVKIRQAKLVNDRKQVPFFKYEPVISDEVNRIRCSLITETIEQQARQYGYFETFKQAVFQALHYAECLQFPVEEWHTEEQWVEQDSPYEVAEDVETKTINKLKIKKAIVKEGLRYHTPHPSRTYRDQSFPAFTLNTGSGCSYAGHWRVRRWEQVMNLPGYYNLNSIGYDNFYSWFSGQRAHSYWTNVMKGCALNFPGAEISDKSTPKDDTEKNIAKWYSRDMADKPIVIADHYELVVPKDVGLGDYDCPVWIRIVLAADDTVIYAAPVCFDPAIIWWGYDFVHGRTHNASMTLEILPFQDQFSNLLAQHLLSVRQNLANITIIDTEVIPEESIQKIENLGERFWRSINILRCKFTEKWRLKVASGQGDPVRNAVISHKFPVQNTSETLNTMKVILDVLERVLVMSSQEVGQSASHEQTREEVRLISSNTSVRVQFTNTGIDFSVDAWKRQLYNAKMSYGRMSAYAQVPMDEPLNEEQFKKLGFTAAGKYDERTKKQYIKGNNTALKYESFVSDRDGQNRIDEAQAAQAMLMWFEKAMANPVTAPAIGADQAIKMLNQIGRSLGFPRDFKITNTGQTQTIQDQLGQALEQLKQYVDENLQGFQKDVGGAVKNIMQVNKEQDVQLKDVAMKLQQVLQMAGMAPSSPEPQMTGHEQVPAMASDLQSAGIQG